MGIVKALEMDGLDCRMLFKQLGLDYDALEDPDARFPQDSMTRLWQRAVELSGNPAIALNMGKVVRPASFHVVGYALMSSRTLVEGFQRLVRYQRIIAESLHLDEIDHDLRGLRRRLLQHCSTSAGDTHAHTDGAALGPPCHHSARPHVVHITNTRSP